jgi:hypothetical protein
MQSRIIDNGERIVAVSSQDVGAILDYATARRNEGLNGSSDMRLAAEFPMVLVETYCNLHGITFADFMANPEHARAMLNDPDLSKFRIWEGRV